MYDIQAWELHRPDPIIKSGTAPAATSTVAPPAHIDCSANNVSMKTHQNCDIHQAWNGTISFTCNHN